MLGCCQLKPLAVQIQVCTYPANIYSYFPFYPVWWTLCDFVFNNTVVLIKGVKPNCSKKAEVRRPSTRQMEKCCCIVVTIICSMQLKIFLDFFLDIIFILLSLPKFWVNLKQILIYLQHWWLVDVQTRACVNQCVIQSQTVSNNNNPY